MGMIKRSTIDFVKNNVFLEKFNLTSEMNHSMDFDNALFQQEILQSIFQVILPIFLKYIKNILKKIGGISKTFGNQTKSQK